MNIALIGYGIMGKHHYRVLKSMPEITLIAVCDPIITETLEENTYCDIDDLLAKETIDAAIISVPTYLHKEIAVKLIKRNIHILIEKPLASNPSQGTAIKEAMSSHNAKVIVGHIERFNPVIVQLKKEIQGKDIFSINITRVGPFPPRIADVGVLTDLAVHDIDLIRHLTQKRIEKVNIFKSITNHSRCEDNAIISLKLENDIIATITTNWLTPFKKRMVEVATSEAYYEANLMTQELLEYSSFQLNNSYVVRSCPVIKGEPLVKELQAFINYIKYGQVSDLATVDDGLCTLEVINE
ncbi:MAG TPA: gfo/Idh/MocA family oxidoreductase [Candidatus Margulisbacteria bacterium]|nr:MAG: oxidoreductase [Candidatus Margulisbacteria bacterium GWD2_39_127]OGI11339.1 MAG: oxidoreductase [Candidatus Margulisbacteria bacterium GWE2_39_32]HAR62771.1 gfo/Idh/MocA family oxidoreductase [Candidatus Margulisiibacteriota bacterium]HCT85692.1 gfo/Idh/MocA family oxidoreductase [Candidatus Margulisiibacteriota bacterium]